jgi:Holliday junction resolvase RusA-like endonuclease
MRLTILGEPKPKQSAKFAKMGKFVKSYQPKEVVQNERNIRTQIISQLPKDFVPYKGGLKMTIIYVFPPLKSMSKKVIKKVEEGTLHKITRPDLDNLTKSLLDAMNGVVFIDDAQVVYLSLTKKYGNTPETLIHIKEVEDETL